MVRKIIDFLTKYSLRLLIISQLDYAVIAKSVESFSDFDNVQVLPILVIDFLLNLV